MLKSWSDWEFEMADLSSLGLNEDPTEENPQQVKKWLEFMAHSLLEISKIQNY